MEMGTNTQENISLGDICQSNLTKYPQFYERLTHQEKIILFNMLMADGKYYDSIECAVEQIPHDMTVGELRDSTGL